MKIWNSYGDYKTNGNAPKLTSLLLLVVVAVASGYITDITLDRIPRGQPRYVCEDDRGFDGRVKSTVCGYEQSYGWPFKRTTSFEESTALVSANSQNARRSPNKGNLNNYVLLGSVVAPYFLLKHIYLSKELEKSKQTLR